MLSRNGLIRSKLTLYWVSFRSPQRNLAPWWGKIEAVMPHAVEGYKHCTPHVYIITLHLGVQVCQQATPQGNY